MVAPSSTASSTAGHAVSQRRAQVPSVLYLDHVGFLGGAELSLIDMCRFRPAADHVLLMSDGPLRTALEATGVGVPLLRASRRLTRFRRESGILAALQALPHVIYMACQIAKKSKPYDLLWANSQKSFIISCFAVLLTRQPLVWHLRDILSADGGDESATRAEQADSELDHGGGTTQISSLSFEGGDGGSGGEQLRGKLLQCLGFRRSRAERAADLFDAPPIPIENYQFMGP